MIAHLKWYIIILFVALGITATAQTPGTFKVRKKVEPTTLPDTLLLDNSDFDADTDSFITRDRPHTFAITGRFNTEGYTLFNKGSFRYGYYATPNIAMGVDLEQKWYRNVYLGPTIGPFVRFDKYLAVSNKIGVPLFTEIGYQIALLKPNPEATSSLGFREIDFGFGYTFVRWLDKGFFIDLKGGWVFTTSEATYKQYSGFTPSIRFNYGF